MSGETDDNTERDMFEKTQREAAEAIRTLGITPLVGLLMTWDEYVDLQSGRQP